MRLRELLAHRPLVVWSACAAIVALGLGAELARPPIPDMGLFLYDAGRVLDGARLYRDVVEINPPLIIWLNLPVVLLARATHVSEFLLYRLATAALVGAVLVYLGRLIHRYLFPEQPGRARYLILLLCFALFALPRFDFGQREHFVAALLLPYVVLVAAQLSGRRPSSLECSIIGVLAGIGIALKPHFGLVLLALEGFRRWGITPAERWRVMPEAAGALAVLAACALGTLLLTPDYIGLATLLAPGYARYMREPFVRLLVVNPALPLVCFAILARVGLRRQTRASRLYALLTTAMVACFLAGAAQQKEFRYHFYPALALAFVLLGVLAAEASDGAPLWTERAFSRASRALLGAIVGVVLTSAALGATSRSDSWRRQREALRELADAVRARAGGRPIGVFSYTIDSAFPLVNYADVPLALRFPGMWPLVASYWDSLTAGGALRYHSIDEMEPFERYFFNSVRDDLLATQPNLLVMLRPARDTPTHGLRRLHYVQYLGRDPELAAFLVRYELVDQKGEYLLYQRRESGVAAIGPPPSAAPAVLEAPPMRRLREIRLGHLDPEFVVGAGVFVIYWILAAAVDRRRAGLVMVPPVRGGAG
jgi:hypothetical protein